MKALIVALTMLASTAATAQQVQFREVRLIDKATKEVVGTLLVGGKYIYVRNKQGVHYATIETQEDGTRIATDPKTGKKIDLSTMPGLE